MCVLVRCGITDMTAYQMCLKLFFSTVKQCFVLAQVATLGSCEFMEVADGQGCKKPNEPQALAFYMYKATGQLPKGWTKITQLNLQAAGPDYPQTFNQTGSLGALTECLR